MSTSETPEPLRETHLRDYYRTLRKHRWLVAGLFLVSVFSVAVWSFVQTPVYQASATVLIEPEPPKVLNIQEVTPIGGPTQEYYRTQYELMTSRPIVDKVIENLSLKKRIPELERADDPVRAVQAAITVEPRRNTRLVAVKFEHTDPPLAAEVTNALARQYVKHNLDIKLRGAQEAMTWLNEQMTSLRGKVQESSVALQNYRVKAGIMGLQEQRQITAQKIMDFNKQYLESQAQRLSVEAKMNELQRTSDRGGAQTIFTVADSLLIQKLKQEASDLETTKAKLSKTYKDKHPEILKVDAQIEQVNQRIEAETKTMLRAVQTEFRVARAREETLLGNVNRLRTEAQELNEKEIQYLNLQRDADSNQQLYEAVLKRLKETGVTGGLETNNVSVIEEATIPRIPIRPRRSFNLLLSVVVGLLVGVGTALTIEYFDTTVKTPDDVERYLGLPVIGIVPQFVVKALAVADRAKTPAGPSATLVAHIEPKSPAAEAYRTLRTSIQFAGLDHKCRSIVVTSSSPGEGKSTTVANFGVVMAQTGSRVCLIDSDLRRPMLHRIFGLGNSRGLTTALLDGLPFAEFAQPTNVANLSVLTSGPLPPNPAELVGSNRMREALEAAAAAFDMILLDSPPVVSVSDAVALATFADGVVMVAQAGKVPHEVIRRTTSQILAVKGRILGVVMNGVNVKRDGYYYDYYRYYNSYYSPDSKKR